MMIIAGALGIPRNADAAPVTVVENPEQFEFFDTLWRSYDVYNNTDVEGPPLNLVAVVVTNEMPATEFIRWTGSDLNTEEDWDSPMFSFLGEGLSWRDFFGGAEFPGPANGYFLDYSVTDGLLTFADDAIGPGEASIGQFWFAGPLSSQFLVAAADVSVPLSNFDPAGLTVLRGTATVPEPATVSLLAAMMIGVACSSRRYH